MTSLACTTRRVITYGAGLIWGPCNEDGFGRSARVDSVDALDTTCAWLDRDDVDLKPTIRLDVVHKAISGCIGRDAGGDPGDLHHRDRAADLALAIAGLSD